MNQEQRTIEQLEKLRLIVSLMSEETKKHGAEFSYDLIYAGTPMRKIKGRVNGRYFVFTPNVPHGKVRAFILKSVQLK